jgi:hypothetical protein
MATTINADTSNGLVMTPDTSGEIKLQSAGTDVATVSSTGITMASGKGLVATGHVLQVVQGEFSGSNSTTSTSMVSTSLNASITPTNSSNKILVLVAGAAANNTLNAVAFLTIYRGATNLAGTSFTFHANPVSGLNNWQSVNMVYLDTPSTTSSTTYTVYFKSSSGTSYLGTGANTNTITLMEIAG